MEADLETQTKITCFRTAFSAQILFIRLVC
jgi:hypothetical protein